MPPAAVRGTMPSTRRRREMGGQKPVLAITMGDPSGIGPEVVLKALAHPEVFAQCDPLVIGDRRILDRAMVNLDIAPLRIDDAGGPATAVYVPGTVTLVDLQNAEPA